VRTLESRKDLPADKTLTRLIKAAVALHDSGVKPPPRSKPAKNRTIAVPDFLAAALEKNKKAQAAFDAFSYSHKKEYVEWLTDAKTDATRMRTFTHCPIFRKRRCVSERLHNSEGGPGRIG
jgi:uncharacterized protein YdeI (YjbR/CyaY-like superfamily)